MRPGHKALRALQGTLLAMVLVVAGPVVSASAAHGESTPGASVAAVNRPPVKTGGLRIALRAHAENRAVENPSCRPQDSTLDCWGGLVLRIPEAGGLRVGRFEVHRVAVVDDHEDGGCGGDEGGCGGHETSTASRVGVGLPTKAMVNGVAILRRPGNTGLPRGSKVQLKIRLTDNGRARHQDTIDVQVNEFVHGGAKPQLYRSGSVTVRQVRIRTRNLR